MFSNTSESGRYAVASITSLLAKLSFAALRVAKAAAAICLLLVLCTPRTTYAQATLGASPTTATPGSSVNVTWNAIPSATPVDWVGLHRLNDPSTAYIDWIYVSCSKSATSSRPSGTCSFPLSAGLPVGTYEMRLHSNNGYTLLARSGAFSVTTGGGTGGSSSSLTATPTSVSAGSAVTTSWSSVASPTAADWIGLHSSGAPSTSYFDWIYVNSCSKAASNAALSTGTCSFSLPSSLAAGTYQFRLHSNNGYTVLASSSAVTVGSGNTGGGGGTTTTGSLTVNASNAASPGIRVHPSDSAARGDGAASFSRTYAANTRVWLSAALRSGNNYFVKWQRNGVDYDAAATTSVLMDAGYTMTAVYETPSCSGITVSPGTDSLRAAVASAPGGSTFCIRAGVHRFTTAVTARANDRFIGETGAILNGSKVINFTREGAYWAATNQTQQDPPFPTSDRCDATVPACIYPEKVFLGGQELTQVTRLADVGSGRFYFDYAADKIYIFDDPTGRTAEATTGSGGIIGYVNSGMGSVTVKNLVFEKFGGGDVSASAHAALKTAEGWRIENNELRFISGVAVNGSGNPLLRNNYIHRNGKYGVNGGGTLEGNTIANNNTDGFDINHDAGGTKFHNTNGLTVRGNTVASNNGPGMWADFDNINTTYENNVVENNLNVGLFHEISCSAVIRYNVARRNVLSRAGQSLWWGAQIYLRSSKDTEIYGNDVNSVGAGVHGIGLRGGDPAISGPGCGSIELRNVTVRDNTIRMDSADRTGLVGGPPGYASTRGIGYRNNTYYLDNLGATNFTFEDRPQDFTKEQWQAAGQDTSGRFLQQ